MNINPFIGEFMAKFKMQNFLHGRSPYLVEPIGLAILRNHTVLITDGAKACIHKYDLSGKYIGVFSNLTDLKYPAGM